MGEAVLKHIAKERGIDIEVDSCGTGGYHVGEEPDERSIHTNHRFPYVPNARFLEQSRCAERYVNWLGRVW